MQQRASGKLFTCTPLNMGMTRSSKDSPMGPTTCRPHLAKKLSQHPRCRSQPLPQKKKKLKEAQCLVTLHERTASATRRTRRWGFGRLPEAKPSSSGPRRPRRPSYRPSYRRSLPTAWKETKLVERALDPAAIYRLTRLLARLGRNQIV